MAGVSTIATPDEAQADPHTGPALHRQTVPPPTRSPCPAMPVALDLGDPLSGTSPRGPHIARSHTPTAERRKVVYLPSMVKACLHDLKGSLETDPDHARSLLARLVGQVTLRRDRDHLIAELRGNLPGILDLDCDNPGAGRGILFERQSQVRVA